MVATLVLQKERKDMKRYVLSADKYFTALGEA
jgi:hypothetical protein